MVNPDEIRAAVDAAFRTTGRILDPWADPHAQPHSPDRWDAAEAEYSRCLDPAKWRVVDARFDAWQIALSGLGLASVERDVGIEQVGEWHTRLGRADRIVPVRPGALPIVGLLTRVAMAGGTHQSDDIVRTQRTAPTDQIGGGVTVGVGDPAVLVAILPDCGCDACDSGSQAELDQMGEYLLDVVTGNFQHLRRSVPRRFMAEQSITVWSGSTHGRNVARNDAARVLADPRGWIETTGLPWFAQGTGTTDAS